MTMLEKLFGVFLICILVVSCGTKAPPVTICYIHRGVMYCQNPAGEQWEMGIEEADNYSCSPTKEITEYLEYCKAKEK